jgi:transposase
MPQPNDLSRSLVTLDQNSTIIAVVEMSQSSWLVGGVVPGIERQPRKKLEPSPETAACPAASLARRGGQGR